MQANEKEVQRKSILKRSMITGLTGGILASLFTIVLYIFNFTEVAPKSYLLKSWTQSAWADSWQGHLVSVGLAGIISLLLASLYFMFFRKNDSLWLGAVLGVLLWFILFVGIHPFLSNQQPLYALSSDTIVTTLCVFILYGSFVGYSISYDYHDVKLKMEKERQN